jgi:hypothetical protein
MTLNPKGEVFIVVKTSLMIHVTESWWVCNSDLNGVDSTSGSAKTLMWTEPFLILVFLQHSVAAKDL